MTRTPPRSLRRRASLPPLTGPSGRRGLTLLETVMALGVAGVVAAGAAVLVDQKTSELRSKMVGEQLALVGSAVESYTRDQAATLLNDVAAAGGVDVIEIDDLKAAGYLPDTAGTWFEVNDFQHQIDVRARLVPNTCDPAVQSDCQLTMLVVARGGDDLLPEQAGRAAQAAGARGGFATTGPNFPAAVDQPNTFVGSYRAWAVDYTDFDLDAADEPRLAYYVPMANLVAERDIIFRGEVPGRPELNEMRTDLHMLSDTCITWGNATGNSDGDFNTCDTAGDNDLDFTAMQADGRFVFRNDGGGGEIVLRPNDAAVDPALGGIPGASLAVNAADAGTYNFRVRGSSLLEGNTDITGDLGVTGDTDLAGNVDVGSGAGDTFTFNLGNIDLNFPTTVDGNGNNLTFTNIPTTTFDGDVAINGDLDLDQCLEVGNPNIATASPPAQDACVQIGRGGEPGALFVDGESRFTDSITGTAFFYSSDDRLKRNVRTVRDSLARIGELRGVSYEWKSDGTADVGLIAQDVRRVFPELVRTDDSGMLSVQYAHLVGPMIEAIKELADENAEMRGLIEELRSRRPGIVRAEEGEGATTGDTLRLAPFADDL